MFGVWKDVQKSIKKIWIKYLSKIFLQISQYSIKWNLESFSNFSNNIWCVHMFSMVSPLNIFLSELIHFSNASGHLIIPPQNLLYSRGYLIMFYESSIINWGVKLDTINSLDVSSVQKFYRSHLISCPEYIFKRDFIFKF